MKSIIVNEEDLKNLQGIGAQLFEDANDPKSRAYIRKLERPKINLLRISLFVFIPIVLLAAACVFLHSQDVKPLCYLSVSAAIMLVYTLIFSKRAAICLVKIYQRCSPNRIRNRCRFEPSCSEYMIMSIEKYGVFKGIKKGINRLLRCNSSGGGFDYP